MEQLRAEGFDLPESAVCRGLEAASIAGRLQVVRKKPKCILDGAHNPGKMDALCAALDSLYPGRPLIGVVGMMARKDWRHAVPQLARRCRAFIAVRPDESELSLPAEELAEFAHAHCAEVYACDDPEDGARLALQLARPGDVLVACGSMYLLEGAKKGFTDA